MSDLTQDQQQIADSVRYLLDEAYLRMIKDTYPSIVDGLVPIQRLILFLLSDVESLSYYTLMKSMGDAFQRRLSLRFINRVLANMANTTRNLYPLVEFFEKDGRAHVRLGRIVKILLVGFDPDFAIENPVVFSVPFLLATGYIGPDFFIPTYNAADLIRKAKNPDEIVIYPDLPVDGYVTEEQYDDGRHYLISRGRMKLCDDGLYQIDSVPYGKTMEGLFEQLNKEEDPLISSVVGSENCIWVCFNPACEVDRSVKEFTIRYLTQTYPISMHVFDERTSKVEKVQVLDIFHAWSQYYQTMLSSMFGLAPGSKDLQDFTYEIWNKKLGELRSSYQDARRTTII